MSKPYSQSKALWAITKASFKAIFNQPIAIFFSLLFPIIFILIFGAFGSGGSPVYRITLAEGTDTVNNKFLQKVLSSPLVKLVRFPDTIARNKELQKGRITAILGVATGTDSAGKTQYKVQLRSTTASANTFGAFIQILQYMKLEFELEESGNKEELVAVAPPQITEVRKYRQIDFVLPGQLGFSILFSTLFGIAFTFFGLREQLVLKRFYASPVSRINILLGIGASRLFFQLINVVVLVLFGYFFLNFTLQHGVRTVIDLLLMSVILLFLLLGVGLIFSSIVKTDTALPLLINLFGFPQMLLSGTFFSIEVFPKWLQPICNALPLTQFNNAVRKISFEGQSILECWREIGILGIWMAVTYAILVKVIRWQ